MNYKQAICALSLVLCSALCAAQDITDVEAKPYGSYAGGSIDTIDLESGNVIINIPLISFPQRGSLPPLTFSVEANNAPYSQTAYACDSDVYNNGYQCDLLSSRYDTSPPGAAYQFQPSDVGGTTEGGWYWPGAIGQIENIGAYITSSFAGGIVTGQYNYTNTTQVNGNWTGNGEYDFTMIDPSGTTHKLESDASNPPSSWNTYRASDGSGYTFVPSGTGNAYDPEDPENFDMGKLRLDTSYGYWLTNPMIATSGVRLGTLYSPTGIQYSSTIVPFAIPSDDANESTTGNPAQVPRALITTETDPSGQNTITRGPWYWSGYFAIAGPPYWDISGIYSNRSPYYTDSVGRIIPDILSIQSTLPMGANLNSGQTVTWQVPGQNNTLLTYNITYAAISTSLTAPPEAGTFEIPPDPATDTAVTGWAIQSIGLPNGTSWTFTYSNGDIQQITTPTGGTISYTYGAMPFSQTIWITRCNATCHAVQSRTETDGLGHSWTTYYSYASLNSLPGCPTTTISGNAYAFMAVSTTDTDSLGNDTVHSFCPLESGAFPVANQYREIRTTYYQGCLPGETGCNSTSGRTPLKTVTKSFEYQPDINPVVGPIQPGITNVLPSTIVESTPGGGTSESRQYSNDSGQPLFYGARVGCYINLPASTCDLQGGTWQWPTPAHQIPISYLSPTFDMQGGAMRQTTTTYEFQNVADPFYMSYMNANMIGLPVSVQVEGTDPGFGITTYGYDENNGSPQGTYGNQTSKTETYYLSGSNNSSGATSIETQTVYNNQGMPVEKIDGRGYVTSITYDEATAMLFPQTIARPATSGDNHHTDTYSYDKNTGQLNWHTDENGQTTTYGRDLLGRVTSIQYPATSDQYPYSGGSTFCYTDLGGAFCPQAGPPFSLYTNTLATPDPSVVAVHTYDGWGRRFRSSVLTSLTGPTYDTTVDTTFDSEGRVASVSNPYRGTPVSLSSYIAPNCGNAFTCYTYDAIGQKTVQLQPDGTAQRWCYDNVIVITSPNNSNPNNCSPVQGNPLGKASWTDVSDETGRHSQQAADPLGRLITVFEPDPVTGNLAMETDYSYDVFGDLQTVSQAGTGGTPVNRAFKYDMPSRVTWACNPEAIAPGQSCSTSGVGTKYIYDANSNLLQKTDNRGVGTGYQYDALNRLQAKWYWGGSTFTPTVGYLYDNPSIPNGLGRLSYECTGCGDTNWLTKTTIQAYDAMGRVTSEQRCTSLSTGYCGNSAAYTMSFTYDLAGKLTSYPSGFGNLAFTNSYDATGRLQTVGSATTGSPPITTTTLFSAPTYTPAGALAGVQLGSNLNLSRTFDLRQRVLSETDTGVINAGGTPGSTTVNILGSEQSK